MFPPTFFHEPRESADACIYAILTELYSLIATQRL